MATFDNATPIKPVMFDGLDEIFDERGSQFLSMRRIQWVKEGDEPDRSKSKLELRKWMVGPDGVEKANKGMTFLTEEGPHELAKVLVHNGFGKTKDIILELKSRDDFSEAVNTLFEKEEESGSGEYFDMRSALLAENNDDEEEDEDE